MPELPEVETTMNAIKHHLLGQRISDVIIRRSNLRFPIPASLAEKMIGHTITNISRRAKYLLFHFQHGILIVHLGMSGSLRILLEHTDAQKHDHVDICFARQSKTKSKSQAQSQSQPQLNNTQLCLRFRDPRRFGAVLWVDGTRAEEHALLKHLGVEPLTRALNGKYLKAKAKKRKIAVKSFIMDSKIVVGVGNIYATESLFAAGIHPLKASGKLTLIEWEKLAAAIKTILKKAIKAGGTTLKDFYRPSGTPGYFAVKLAVYGRQGQACLRCKHQLKSIRIGQRSTVYCAKCQQAGAS